MDAVEATADWFSLFCTQSGFARLDRRNVAKSGTSIPTNTVRSVSKGLLAHATSDLSALPGGSVSSIYKCRNYFVSTPMIAASGNVGASARGLQPRASISRLTQARCDTTNGFQWTLDKSDCVRFDCIYEDSEQKKWQCANVKRERQAETGSKRASRVKLRYYTPSSILKDGTVSGLE
eukprot:7396509-Pyramimonas_sp.AAC.1